MKKNHEKYGKTFFFTNAGYFGDWWLPANPSDFAQLPSRRGEEKDGATKSLSEKLVGWSNAKVVLYNKVPKTGKKFHASSYLRAMLGGTSLNQDPAASPG